MASFLSFFSFLWLKDICREGGVCRLILENIFSLINNYINAGSAAGSGASANKSTGIAGPSPKRPQTNTNTTSI